MTFNDFVRENLYHFYQNDEFIKEYDNIISIPNIKEYIQLPSLIVDENLQHEDFNKLTIKKLDEISAYPDNRSRFSYIFDNREFECFLQKYDKFADFLFKFNHYNNLINFMEDVYLIIEDDINKKLNDNSNTVQTVALTHDEIKSVVEDFASIFEFQSKINKDKMTDYLYEKQNKNPNHIATPMRLGF